MGVPLASLPCPLCPLFDPAVPEFTVVLNEDNLFDIFIDGERCYFDFDSQDLKEFAEDFAESNK